MKSEVYRRKVDTLDELLDHIMDVIACLEEHDDRFRHKTRHFLTQVVKCIHVDG